MRLLDSRGRVSIGTDECANPDLGIYTIKKAPEKGLLKYHLLAR